MFAKADLTIIIVRNNKGFVQISKLAFKLASKLYLDTRIFGVMH